MDSAQNRQERAGAREEHTSSALTIPQDAADKDVRLAVAAYMTEHYGWPTPPSAYSIRSYVTGARMVTAGASHSALGFLRGGTFTITNQKVLAQTPAEWRALFNR